MNPYRDHEDPLKVLGRSKGYSRETIIKEISRHEKFTPLLIKQVKKIPDVVLKNLGTPLAKKIVKMMREIFKEAYRAKQFTRTEINNKGVLFGIVKLKHDVIDLLLKYFHERWPQCMVCLYNEVNHITSIMDEKGCMFQFKKSLEDVVARVSKTREIRPYFEDIQFSGNEIFETLYHATNVEERENPHFFKQMIPKHCYQLPGMREGVERLYNPKNKRIDDFF